MCTVSNAPCRLFMKPRLSIAIILLLSLVQAGGALAQGRWRDMPREERHQMRQQMREHWDQQREVRRDEREMRFQDVPPEDRRRLREELREHRRSNGDGFGPDGRPPRPYRE